MAGAGLIEIKKRIKSVTNTKKITNAMGLVATAKLKKVREKLNVNKKFQISLDDVMMNLFANEYFQGKNIYTFGNGSKKKLYVAMMSDFGLCGGFNANVLKATHDLYETDLENSDVLAVGSKGKMFISRFKVKPIINFTDIQDVPTMKEAKNISSKILELYRTGQYGEVYLVYTEFVSAVKKEVKVKKLLPFEIGETKATLEVEPSLELVADSIIDMYFRDLTLNALYNSKASEQSTRMASMDSATKNANDLLDALKLKFNRVRQSVITQEISEIVSGAEAQK